MKIKGITVEPPGPKVIVIPLGDQKIVFKAAPVLNFDEMYELAPRPEPEIRNYGPKDGGIKVMDSDPSYLARLQNWCELKTHWTIITSLRATDDLEWDNIKYDDPNTWHMYEQELRDSGFSDRYIDAICGTVVEACGLSQNAIDEATESFLATQAEK